MLKKLLCALLLLSYTIHGQNYVQGTISTTNEIGSRIVLYQLKGVKQLYINNDTISNGAFKIAIPENATKGMYRLFYDMKNQGFVDFIYNKENVELQFDTSDSYGTLAFSNSEENIAYHKYLQDLSSPNKLTLED